MTLFQLTALLFLGIFLIRQIFSLRGKSTLHKIFDFRWFILSVLALLVIIFPAISVWVAEVFGISRGVDVVIYVSVIWLFYKVYSLENEIFSLNDKIDELVRKIALQNTEQSTHESGTHEKNIKQKDKQTKNTDKMAEK